METNNELDKLVENIDDRIIQTQDEMIYDLVQQNAALQQHADEMEEKAIVYMDSLTLQDRINLRVALHNYEQFKKK